MEQREYISSHLQKDIAKNIAILQVAFEDSTRQFIIDSNEAKHLYTSFLSHRC
jgi:hypothetical protein